MAMSVRLDPTLETRVEQESRRLGITKSDFVKDALETTTMLALMYW
jgi:predicted DNA-binding protein